ncbi:carbohydrate sulfotransferase 12-like [Colossoma macropomum]|uniref:carbohydrate sulfotransferase 12-like n=1 Tax=Colossoma macropomum TaxID=42526 RepID=UPI001863F69C|nr:carbohydrate sulfotransferase 12-like [Colossoma macropomum]
MKRLRHFYFVLILESVLMIFYVNRYWTHRSEAEEFFRPPLNTSLLKPEHDYSKPQSKTVSSSYTGSNYYNLIWNGFANFNKETGDEEDDLLDGPDLENRRRNWKFHSSPIPLELKHRQYARKKLIHDLCDSNSTLGFNGKWQTIDDIPNRELANLLVDDRHGIIYCYVPKVACTEWKRVMIVLSESLKVNGVPYRDLSDIPVELIHGNSTQYLNRYNRTVMKHKLQQYKKFMFVREPFVRLISAYRDKFQTENQPFYKRYAVPILKRFGKIPNPPASAKEARTAGIAPSFSNFIQYILSLPAEKYELLDEHWRQMTHLCHPCQIHYDFIGKMETMEEDAAHLLRMLRVDNIVQFPKSKSSRTDENWVKNWFPYIPIKWRRKLFKLFEIDYKLFGYQVPEYLLHP